ncbi:hypothetical protein LTR85_001317 [Meristemomyces frigidus]|nr:hypothetical protein LTR85_001317 [Meristemomyces frigidus]
MAAAAVSRPGTLQCWLQPPASSKRKRTEETILDIVSSEEDADDKPAKKKKAKPVSKAKTATAPPKRSTNPAKEAKKLYADTLKAIDKETAKLD